MKIKDNFILRKLVDDYVVVPVGSGTCDFDGIITLNETGAFLFERLLDGAEKEDLLTSMLSEYEIDEKTAAFDIEAFIKKLDDADLLIR